MKRVALLICLALSLPVPALAGMFDDDEARKQVRDLRTEVDALRQRIDTLARNQLDFANQLETLRADVARLRGQVEVQTNSIETAQKRQQDFYVDLDARLRKLESGSSGVTDAGAAKADPQAEMRDYEAALGLFRSSKFKDAQGAFEGFIATHAKSTLLPNATYWLASALYQQKQFSPAIDVYGKVPATWPNDPKAPDALLGRANAQLEVRDEKAAVQSLQLLVDKYPTSPAAETARARLKQIAPKKR